MKNIEKIKKDFAKKINQNELMSKKHWKVYSVLNYIKYLLILVPEITEYVSISAFASLRGNPIENSKYEFCNSIKKLRNNCSI